MLPETVARLARLPRIVGIKEAVASMQRVRELAAQCPPGFGLLSGDDATVARGHAQWRQRRHLGDRQCGARADEPDGRRRAGAR